MQLENESLVLSTVLGFVPQGILTKTYRAALEYKGRSGRLPSNTVGNYVISIRACRHQLIKFKDFGGRWGSVEFFGR